MHAHKIMIYTHVYFAESKYDVTTCHGDEKLVGSMMFEALTINLVYMKNKIAKTKPSY